MSGNKQTNNNNFGRFVLSGMKAVIDEVRAEAHIMSIGKRCTQQHFKSSSALPGFLSTDAGRNQADPQEDTCGSFLRAAVYTMTKIVTWGGKDFILPVTVHH